MFQTRSIPNVSLSFLRRRAVFILHPSDSSTNVHAIVHQTCTSRDWSPHSIVKHTISITPIFILQKVFHIREIGHSDQILALLQIFEVTTMNTESFNSPTITLDDFATKPEIHRFRINDGEYYKEIHIPQCDGATSEVILHVWRFAHAVAAQTFEDEANKFALFRQTLSGNAADRWDKVYNDIPDGDPLDFEAAMQSFIAKYCDNDNRVDQIDYLCSVRKPRKMEVESFDMNIENINTIAGYMPGTAAVLADDERKRAFFNGMPAKWRQKFADAGNKVDAMNILAIKNYMKSQEKLSNQLDEANHREMSRRLTDSRPARGGRGR